MNSEILFGQIRVKTLLFCLLGIGFYVIRVETRCIHLAPRAPRRNDRLWRGHCCLLSDECFWIFCPRCITRIVGRRWFNGTVPSRVVKTGESSVKLFHEAYMFILYTRIFKLTYFSDIYSIFRFLFIVLFYIYNYSASINSIRLHVYV